MRQSSQVAAASWLGWEGHPLYPPLDGGDLYGVPYGPALFHVTGLFLWLFGPSIAASKIGGVLAFAAAHVLSYLTIRRTGAGLVEALAITGTQCVLLAAFTEQAYVWGVRSDAFLFLIAQTALLVAIARPSVMTAVMLGFLGGIAVNLRADGGPYVFPAFVYCLARSQSIARGGRLAAAAILAGLVGLTLPFLPQDASVVEYIHYFQVFSHNQLERWLLERSVVFTVMCLAPLGWLYTSLAPPLPTSYWMFLATTVACMALTWIPASEAGADPHHLLPYLPSLCWAFATMRQAAVRNVREMRARVICDRISLGLIAALLFGYGPVVGIAWGRTVHTFAEAAVVNEGVAEIDQTLSANPGLRVAVGPGLSSFFAEGLEAIPVFRGNPLPIDTSAWMNLRMNGVNDQAVLNLIKKCAVDIWLIPNWKPFSDYYNYTEEVYPKVVIDAFHKSFELRASGKVFDQWWCITQ